MRTALQMKTRAVVSAVAALVCASCSSHDERRPDARGLVLYTKGASTDPHAASLPNGFGVLIDPGTAEDTMFEVAGRRLGEFNGATWLDSERILVPQKAPPLRPPLIYRVTRRALRWIGRAPIDGIWSPDQRLIATEPLVPCEKGQALWQCYRSSARVLVYNAAGARGREVARGHLGGWTPHGRLLVTDPGYRSGYKALDVESGSRSLPLSPRRLAAFVGATAASLGPPRWSGDRRYIAAMIGAAWPKQDETNGAIVVAHADGTPIRVLRSPYIVSMFAWSPTGNRLAYTTSGFPAPHELFVIADAEAKRKRIYATRDHFDWITWSPDGRQLLLDEGAPGRWKIFSVDGGEPPRAMRRLGGRPLWCCPVNSYATNNW